MRISVLATDLLIEVCLGNQKLKPEFFEIGRMKA